VAPCAAGSNENKEEENISSVKRQTVDVLTSLLGGDGDKAAEKQQSEQSCAANSYEVNVPLRTNAMAMAWPSSIR
jgi:hypothetical protein